LHLSAPDELVIGDEHKVAPADRTRAVEHGLDHHELEAAVRRNER
jgi:hypothetical protein